jgi:hypothetical protein
VQGVRRRGRTGVRRARARGVLPRGTAVKSRILLKKTNFSNFF